MMATNSDDPRSHGGQFPSRAEAARKRAQSTSQRPSSSTPPARQTPSPQRRSVMGRNPSFDDVLGHAGASQAGRGPKQKVTATNGGGKKRRSWGKRIGLGLVYMTLAGLALGAGLFAYLYYSLDIPEADEVALAQTTTVYYNDGTTRMGTYSEVNRTIIDPTTVPAHVGHAIVASEDRTFYTNSGIDLKGIARALYTNLTTGSRQGGSTLTQQYVERYYVGETTSYTGKAKEAILALKINREQSKDQILGNYMNTIYFGRGAYGIEAAAKVFFGKKAADLTLSEAAMLAGIIPAPSAWDPALDAEQAQTRWKRVLDLMVEDGWVSKDEAAAQTFPQTLPLEEAGSQDFAGPQGYLLSHIRRELKNLGEFTDEQIENGGLKIVSTVDKSKFDAIVEAANTMNSVEGWNPERMHVAISSIDPATGEIVAEYGGPDFQKRQQNAATQDIAGAGSTFKVFTLLAHAQNGGSVYDTFDGSSPRRFDGLEETVENDGGYSFGRVNLIRATEYSINTAFVELNEKVGSANTKKAAIAAGIPEDTLGLDDTLLNTLGFAAPRNVDLAASYATIASGGLKTQAHIVREVYDAFGNLVYKPVINPKRVFTQEEVSAVLPALEAVVGSDGTASAAGQLGMKVAGKTGTSSEQKSAQFVAFTPFLSTAVSMYQSDENGNSVPLDNIGGLNQFHGGDWPADVWAAYMKRASEGMGNADFTWRLPPRGKKTDAPERPQSTPITTPTPQPQPQPEPEPEVPEPIEIEEPDLLQSDQQGIGRVGEGEIPLPEPPAEPLGNQGQDAPRR